jgi:hypothetical protein
MSDTPRTIKPISPAGVATALEKAHRYRLLNDSIAAESICLDVLALEPSNRDALVTHVLAITDQFATGSMDDLQRAEAAVARLTDPYATAYYHGVICERWAKAVLQRATPRAHEMAHDWVEKALAFYATAEQRRPSGNDESILRWNTCVRMLERDPRIKPREAEAWEPSLE